MPRPLLTGWAGAAAGQAQKQPASLAITSVNPVYAQPGKTVTVQGTLTNTSARAISGLSVQILSSGSRFTSRGLMQDYVDGSYNVTSPLPGAVTNLRGTLAPGATAAWSVTLQP